VEVGQEEVPRGRFDGPIGRGQRGGQRWISGGRVV